MGFLQNLQNVSDRLRRSITDWLMPNYPNRPFHSEPDFFDISIPGYSNVSSFGGVGIWDASVSPVDIYDMCTRDPFFSGLLESLVSSIFRKDWYVDVVKDADGKPLGSYRTASVYTRVLQQADLTDKLQKLTFGDLGDGGGNVLVFTVRNEKGDLEFKVEPFIQIGRPRVRAFINTRLQKTFRYEVVEPTGEATYTLSPETDYVHHVRYSAGGDWRFSTGPAKRAVYWYILKKYIAGTALADFKNGPQSPVIGSPDFASLAQLAKVMAETDKVSSGSKMQFFQNPVLFYAKLMKEDSEIFRSIMGQARQSNKLIMTQMPMKFDRVERDYRRMELMKLSEECDRQMAYSLRMSPSLLNAKDSKYSNAEIESDSMAVLVEEPYKRKLERIVEKIFIPVLIPSFDTTKYRYRHGRDPNEENLAVYDLKTKRNESQATIIQMLASTPSYEYNLETDEIVKVGKKTEGLDDIVDNDEVVEQNSEERVALHIKHILETKARESGKSYDALLNIYKKAYSKANTKEEMLKEAVGLTQCSAYIAGRFET